MVIKKVILILFFALLSQVLETNVKYYVFASALCYTKTNWHEIYNKKSDK